MEAIPDDLSTFTDEGLAIACATEIMGWRIGEPYDGGSLPCLYTNLAEVGFLVERHADSTTVEAWEPWRDPCAWWEIVEKMDQQGYLFSLETSTTPEAAWLVIFGRDHDPVQGVVGQCRGADTPGRAVMLAALMAKRGG
jgi:hypothetical protein